jgi:iron complex outermembrane receptor protein
VQRLTVSLAAFYNNYDDIRSVSTNASSGGALVIGNANRGEEWGTELALTWQVLNAWRLRAGYTYLDKTIFVKPGGTDVNQGQAEGNDPQNQFLIQSLLNLPAHLQLDATFRYVDTLPSPVVPDYFALDVRLGWEPLRNLEFSVVGQSLLDPQHPEFGPSTTRQEIPRSIFGKVTWRF